MQRLRPYLPYVLIALVAIAIAWAFAATTLQHTRPMGLPIDDGYIYLTYAKQFGRLQPFSYYPGGGYSAGSTSVLWPMLLAPFWALGARGHALVWVSFGMCTALYAATGIGIYQVVKKIAGAAAAVIAPVILFGIAPFAWGALSGMEVAFASALLATLILLLLEQAPTGPPSKKLIAVLACTSLSRPEAMLLVFGIVGIAVIQRLRQRDRRSAAWWLAPLAAPALWLCANKLFAGQLFPNTGVAKSHFYLPGFDWTYWFGAVGEQIGKLAKGLFWDPKSPLVWPRVVLLLWVIGAVRIALWSRRERRLLAGAVIIAAPFALMLTVIASSGMTSSPWSFQNYRYIAPAFPLLAITCAAAFVLPIASERRAVIAGHIAAIAVVAALFTRAAFPGLRADMRLFAQGAMDSNTQVVAIGEYLHRKLPDASVMFHDAGAIAYFGDGRVYDMLGLVTNYQAGIANNGPGARFEFLESLPAEQRPTHFAYYPSWLGTNEFYGEVLFNTPLRPGFEPRRVVGDGNMQVIVADFDHVGTGERPIGAHPGWAVVDRLDIADLASERAHGWRGAQGRRKLGDPTARWSLVAREVGPGGLVIDGGRTIRGGTERFTVTLDPAKPTRLVLRCGGPAGVPFQETISAPVPVEILDDDDRVVATQTIPAPDGRFEEVTFELPAGTSTTLHTRAASPYRAFHWFALQPE
ncbi:MAG: hypothetical protein IPQ07_08160 [Myxococcales bacterium]|nr:hypothetical protein [Myxococcales bacterium]